MSTAIEPPRPQTRAGVIGKAASNPLNLGIAAGAATLAIGLGSLPLGLLGGLAYLAMVAFDAMSKDKKRTSPARLTVPSSLPDPKTLLDPDIRAAVEKLIASKGALQRALDDTPAEVLTSVSTTVASLGQLEAYAARLASRGEDIMRHLKEVDIDALVAEVKQLTQRARDATNPGSRTTFEEAKQARMDELRALKELKATKETIDANLMRVCAVYGALPTKVVQLRALDAQQLDQISGDMNEELTAVRDELQTSEKIMKNVEIE